eukprot:3430278-Alexandrium_andersonii.AAC.1
MRISPARHAASHPPTSRRPQESLNRERPEKSYICSLVQLHIKQGEKELAQVGRPRAEQNSA